MAEQIKGSQNPEYFAGGLYSLQAPGLTANIEIVKNDKPATRGNGAKLELQHETLLAILIEQDIFLTKQIEITVLSDSYAKMSDVATRSGGLQTRTSLGEAAMVLRSPRTQEKQRSAVLYTDESGEQRWIFPQSHSTNEFAFALPREVAPTERDLGEDGTTRGKITKGIRKVVMVLAWLLDDEIGATANYLAKKFEEKKRPYSFMQVTASDFNPEVSWADFNGKHSLLLLHGTFSTWPDAFDGLVHSEEFVHLLQYYEGRVLAFNHPTLHKNPTENIDYFLSQIPNEVESLNLDIISHSRGALVGRELCARQLQFNGERKVSVGKAVFVAGPNSGTKLVDSKHLVQLLNSYTNLLIELPDTATTIILEAVISLVKIIGSGMVGHLPGLQSMLPGCDFLQELDTRDLGSTRIYAMGAQFGPSNEQLLKRLGERAIMTALSKIFDENNDMIVPNSGCYKISRAGVCFTVPDQFKKDFGFESNINHLNFFRHTEVNNQMLEWLRQKE